jgi:hypothetical protein
VTFEEVNGFTAQLKSLQVQAHELCGEYHAAALAFNDASDHLWSVYCKNYSAKVAKKQNKARQSSMSAFIAED